MKLMALELDDRDMMVIRFLLFCKREIIFENIFWIFLTRNQVLDIEFFLRSSSNSSSYQQNCVILNGFESLMKEVIKSLIKNDISIIYVRFYETFVKVN